MFDKVYQATHPSMMDGASNEDLRERYLVEGLFRDGAVALNYTHNERMIIGGAAPIDTPLALPVHSEPASAEGESLATSTFCSSTKR